MIKKLVFPVLLLPIIFLITGCSNTYRVKTSTGGSFTAEEKDVACRLVKLKPKRDFKPVRAKLYLGSGDKGGLYDPETGKKIKLKKPVSSSKDYVELGFNCRAVGLLTDSTGKSRYIRVENKDCESNPNKLACSAGRFFNLLD